MVTFKTYFYLFKNVGHDFCWYILLLSQELSKWFISTPIDMGAATFGLNRHYHINYAHYSLELMRLAAGLVRQVLFNSL